MSQFGLGRGLDALIPRTPSMTSSSDAPTQTALADGITEIPVERIKPNRFQPRTEFDQEALADLAASIREYGILQPLIVENVDGSYHLIAGERRLRASKMAGLSVVPVLIRDVDDHQRLALAIIENLQRVNLNPIETAFAYQRLVDDFNLTQEEVANRMGKSRAGVANTIRLLRLHPEIQEALRSGDLTEGHGKLLAGIEDADAQHQAYKAILANNLSVGQTAEHVRPLRSNRSLKSSRAVDPNIAAKEAALRELLGTKVRIDHNKGKGVIKIEYYSDEELRSLLSQLLSNQA